MISPEEVRKLASLARVKLTPEEETALAMDMESVLGYVEQIQSVSIEAGEKGKEPVRNVLRDDGHPHETGIHTEAILAETPESEDGYVKVKKIL